ncbi:DHRS13 [Mytilus edulis]|uniref:DHRS13 n=1 Tax=Mytilus edulis TaxID=6550 RepID=A0A8S3T1K9_MYTED|nr:DHRS13 [Mytilus edulis]
MHNVDFAVRTITQVQSETTQINENIVESKSDYYKIIILTLKYYFGTTRWCKSTVTLNGRTVLITGGNIGIGKATAIDLANRGARVIIASRNKEKAIQTIKEINDKTGNDNVRFMYLDLMDLEIVRQFAEQFLNEEKRLDILINNSGTPVTANSVHPGLAATDILMAPLKSVLPEKLYSIVDPIFRFISLDSAGGAQTTKMQLLTNL